MSREAYSIKTIASAAHLLASCVNSNVCHAILRRAATMLQMVWDVEYRSLKRRYTPSAHLSLAIENFWNNVAFDLCHTTDRCLYRFEAVHGGESNSPGHNGQIRICFQPNQSAQLFSIFLTQENLTRFVVKKYKQRRKTGKKP